MHITTVRPSEMMLDALVRCDLIAVSTREAAKLFTLPGEEQNVPEFGRGDYGRAELKNTAADWRNKPELSEIMAGKVSGRGNDGQVIVCSIIWVLVCNFPPAPRKFSNWHGNENWDGSCRLSGSARMSIRSTLPEEDLSRAKTPRRQGKK